MKTRRGMTLVELMVVGILLTVVGGSLWGVITIAYQFHNVVIGQNNAYAEARKGIDLMADHIRNAQLNTSNTYVLNSVLDTASTNSITYYSTYGGTGETVRYRLNGTNIERTFGGNTTVTAKSISSLELTYYKLSTYNGTWVNTTDSHAPTTAELPYVAGVEIKVGVAMDGYTTEYKTLVRLRNSPRKTKLSGS